mgnify:CR=1 FL=1
MKGFNGIKNLNGLIIKSVMAALLVKLVFYFLISLLFIIIFQWAGISSFSIKYVIVLALGLFFFSIMFYKNG